ncbi:hypothetical protein ACVW00_001016 [Marmoricola sp. URHA0025 HA25]
MVRDYPQTTAARRKVLKIDRLHAIDVADLEAVASRVTEMDLARESEISAEKRRIIEHYRNSPEFGADVSELLRPSLEQTFAQIHDYRQLVSQIVQHVNVFLETRHPGIGLDAQLEKVTKIFGRSTGPHASWSSSCSRLLSSPIQT